MLGTIKTLHFRQICPGGSLCKRYSTKGAAHCHNFFLFVDFRLCSFVCSTEEGQVKLLKTDEADEALNVFLPEILLRFGATSIAFVEVFF